MHLVKTSLESALSTHWSVPYIVSGVRTGHRFVGERPWRHAHQDQSMPLPSAHVPVWPVESWTSEDVEDERDMISKIRARHDMRNRLLYNFIQSSDGRGAKPRAGSGPPKCTPHPPGRPRNFYVLYIGTYDRILVQLVLRWARGRRAAAGSHLYFITGASAQGLKTLWRLTAQFAPTARAVPPTASRALSLTQRMGKQNQSAFVGQSSHSHES